MSNQLILLQTCAELDNIRNELALLAGYGHKHKDNEHPCLYCYHGFSLNTCNRVEQLKKFQSYLQNKLDSLTQIPKCVETQHDPLPVMFELK